MHGTSFVLAGRIDGNGREALLMGVTWSVTLVVAMVAARLAGLG